MIDTIIALARQLAAASTPAEVGEVMLSQTRQLIGWDAAYVQVVYRQRNQIECLLGQRVTTKGDVAPLAPWSFPLESRESQQEQLPGAPAILDLPKPSKPVIPFELDHPGSLNIMVAPLGPFGVQLGHVVLVRTRKEAFSEQQLQLLQAISQFGGDALQRAIMATQPIRSPDAISEENRILRSLFDSLPDYLYIKDLEGKFIFANQALLRSLGAFSLSDVLGKSDSDFAPPHLHAQYRADEVAIMTSGEPMIDREEMVVEASGERVIVHTTKVPLKDERGRVMGLVGVGHNPRSVDDTSSPADFRRGTVAEAAKRAGVSIATVSRAFNGSPLVTEETRQKVYAAAREVGYKPNVAARSLSKGKSETVALVLKAAQLKGEFYTDMLAGFQSTMRKRGLDVLLSVAPDDADPLGWVRDLVIGSACGAMAVHVEILQGADIEVLKSLPVPVVLANYCPDEAEALARLTSVGFDNREGAKQAVRHLVALGHVDIGFLGGTPGHPDFEHRMEGFRAAMAEAMLPVNDKWVISCEQENGTPSGVIGIQQMFASQSDRPSAVVCATDTIAAGAIVGAKTWGQRVPEDLSVVGFDDLSWASVYSPQLTTIRHNGYDLGMAVGQALISRVDRRGASPGRVLLPTRLVIRQSTVSPAR